MPEGDKKNILNSIFFVLMFIVPFSRKGLVSVSVENRSNLMDLKI